MRTPCLGAVLSCRALDGAGTKLSPAGLIHFNFNFQFVFFANRGELLRGGARAAAARTNFFLLLRMRHCHHCCMRVTQPAILSCIASCFQMTGCLSGISSLLITKPTWPRPETPCESWRATKAWSSLTLCVCRGVTCAQGHAPFSGCPTPLPSEEGTP